MSPDLPTPETMTRPLAPWSSSTARAKSSFSRSATASIEVASSRRTRRPSSTNSRASGIAGSRLREVAFQHLGPHTAGLEQSLDDLPHGPMAARSAGHVAGDGAHLGDG